MGALFETVLVQSGWISFPGGMLVDGDRAVLDGRDVGAVRDDPQRVAALASPAWMARGAARRSRRSRRLLRGCAARRARIRPSPVRRSPRSRSAGRCLRRCCCGGTAARRLRAHHERDAAWLHALPAIARARIDRLGDRDAEAQRRPGRHLLVALLPRRGRRSMRPPRRRSRPAGDARARPGRRLVAAPFAATSPRATGARRRSPLPRDPRAQRPGLRVARASTSSSGCRRCSPG